MRTSRMNIHIIVAVLVTLTLELAIDTNAAGTGTKLVDGRDAKRTENRFTVRIEKAGNSTYFCQGALVGADWVLTAANCFDGAEALSSYSIVAGDFITNKEDGEVVIQPDDHILHEDYNSTTLANNVALVHLAASVNVSLENIAVVDRLSTTKLDAKVPKKDRCTMSSFGPDDNGAVSRKMQTLDVTVQDDSACANVSNYDVDSQLCYTGDPGAPCNGDEGSPIVCLVGKSWTLVGVHSVGSCATGSHSASQVSFHKTWITRTISRWEPITVSCGVPPTVTGGTFETNGTNVENDVAVLACDADYVTSSDVIADKTITCESTGDWSSASAECVISCGMPPVVSSGIFNSSGTNLINDTATLECDDGYTLSSVDMADAVITCQASGDWTASGSTCIKICDSIPSINNGSFILSGRNVENATAVLTCDSGYNESEAGVSITCQSDGSWTSTDATCIRNCGIPAVVDNGVFNFNGSNLVNDTATLECTGGYTTSTEIISDATITCQENGDWTSSAATCVKICDSLPVQSNGAFELSGSNVDGATAELKCDVGFNVSDSDFIITCQSDGSWTEIDSTCLRSCGMPPVVSSGVFNSSGTNLINDTATLECDDGYTLSSVDMADAVITCQASGDWTASGSTCIKICDSIPSINNGSFILSGRNVESAIAVLTCDSGYNESEADVSITCQSDGSWTSTDATCIRNCGIPAVVDNGVFNFNGSNLVNDTATLECTGGYTTSTEIISEATITCQENGDWTSSAATCVKICDSLPVQSNGSFELSGRNVDGATAELKCDVGFNVSDSDFIITCQSDGSWTEIDSTCLRSCGMPPVVSSGVFNSSGTNLINDTATLECDDGYTLSSVDMADAVITCQASGDWTASGSTCIKICDSIPSINNGSFVLSGRNVESAIAVLTCDSGYNESEADVSITCQSDGSWTSTAATCIRNCGIPAVVDNGVFNFNGSNLVNDTATLECTGGYTTSTEIISDATITCQENGDWTSSAATCVKICDSLPVQSNGSFELSGRNVDGATAELKCDVGFNVSDSDFIITCQSDGSWTEIDSTCLRSCGMPPVVSSGIFNSSGTNLINDTATLECDDGYTLSSVDMADAVITCQSSGDWTASGSTCIKICDSIPSINNGSFVLSGRNVESAIAVLTCDSGYNESEADVSITCQSDGSWTSTAATCIRNCGIPAVVDNGVFNFNGSNLVNDTATLECTGGYTTSTEIISDATISCQENGDWTSSAATCVKICDSLPVQSNGSFELSGRNVDGATAELKCDVGFNVSDSDFIITCQSDGSWTEIDSTCLRSCGMPPVVSSGIFNSSGTNLINDTATLECDDGYTLSSVDMADAVITCQASGDWTASGSTCIKICDSIPSINNGSFILSGRNIESAIAVLTCDSGYNESEADVSITCQSDGSWTSTDATCIRNCGIPAVVDNGVFNFNGSNLVNDTATLECTGGYTTSTEIISEATITCQENGDWTSSAATCVKICDSLPVQSNGSFELSGRNVDGATAELKCDVGFNVSDSDFIITCQSDGSWTEIDSTCLRSCGMPPVVSSGIFNSSGTNLINDTATLECDDGYTLSSVDMADAVITCQASGDWTASGSTCIKICDSIPSINNGSFILSGRNVESAIAVLTCDSGYNESEADVSITCQSDGSWTSTDATCIRNCGIPAVVDNGVFNFNGSNLVNDTATLECTGGYTTSTEIISDATITCQENGDWTSSAATCVKICDSLPVQSNGSFELSGRNVDGATAELKCDVGFNVSDSDFIITCQSDGSWTEIDSTCLRSCGLPPVVSSGIFNSSGTNLINDTATLECDDGYTLSSVDMADAVITCQASGDWTASGSTCIKICDSIPSINNGSFILSGRNIESAIAVLTCDSGYNESEADVSITCQSDGSWTSTDATCIRNCGIPAVVDNGVFNFNGSNLVNDTATLECTGGYTTSTEIISEATITCQENGDWTSSAATCVKICDSLPVQSNGSFELSGRNVDGATAELMCDVGFNVSDSDFIITCQSDGSWTEIDSTCLRSCGMPPVVSSGVFNSSGTNLINDTATLECDDGYTLSSVDMADAVITCQASGDWTASGSTCIKICDSIPSINNGSFILSGRNVESAIAVLTCDSGYNESEANVSITCQSDGFWTSTDATCIRNCGIPAVVDNGVFNFNGSNLVNDTATLECTGGYTTSTEIISEATITCQENGDWTSSAATCVKICDSLPVQSNGSFELSGRNVDGATAELKCDVGFNVSDSDFIITCQSDGSWTEIDSTCLRSCGMPPVVSSGIFNSSGTNLINDTATLECDDGYTLSSVDMADAVITCQASGDWTASGSTCIKICDSIPSINNGSFILSGRNVESAIAVLTCDSGYNESEADVSITCQSDGSWTSTDATCIRNCGIPAVVDNGVFNFNGSNLVNDTATLECTGGYTTSTEIISDATITCQENGDWTSSAATCVKICDSLPVQSNGSFELSGRNVDGATAELKCDVGFNVSDSDFIITCQSDGSWTEIDSTCLRSCGMPPVVSSGIFNSSGTNLINDTATLECDDGYTLSSVDMADAVITCQASGDWTASGSTCIKICDSIPSINNGSFVLSGKNVESAIAVLTCDSGYNESEADVSITCQSDGSWTSTDATCIRNCGIPAVVDNGVFNFNGSNLVNDTATLECTGGYTTSTEIISDATITCQENGDWTSSAATCVKICDSLPVQSNGSFELSGRNVDGATAELKCDVGFNVSDSDFIITCQSDGSWTEIDSTCLRSCGMPPVVSSGIFNSSGTNLINDTATLECDDGYTLSSVDMADAVITCQASGDWTASGSTCIKICDSIPSLNNGSFILSGRNVESAIAVLTCDSGYNESEADVSITCQSDGSWSSTDATCIRNCGIPAVVDNGVFNFNGSNLVNDTATLECTGGYTTSTEIISDATITCQENGDWTSSAATCVKICDSLPVQSNGSFELSGRNVDGATAELKCDVGFNVSDSDFIITCQSDGSWTEIDSTCLRSCGMPPVVSSGIFNSSGTNLINDTATLECDDGYTLSSVDMADAVITCQASGDWTASGSTCIKICDSIPSINNGSFVLSGRNVESAIAVLTCDSGYNESEADVSITCQSDGSWASTDATCIRNCGIPAVVDNGVFNFNGSNLVNDTATLECTGGYTTSTEIISDATITCQENGDWTSSAATCVKICDSLPVQSNGSFELSGRNVDGATAELKCDVGFNVSDSDFIITCQSDGSWTEIDSTCLRSCGMPPVVSSGIFNSSGTNLINDTATLECDDGYTLSSVDMADADITCQASGDWTASGSTCIKICDSIPSINNGSFILSGRNVESAIAVLTCDSGYNESEADVSITCQSDGSWTSTDATCIRNCGIPAVVDNGVFNFNGSNLVNDTATLECTGGYTTSTEIISDATITCQENGDWTSSAATCVKICDSLPVQSNGSFELSGRNVDGATAELKCDVGFNVSDSDFIITCQSDGSWTEIDSTCLRSCGMPPVVSSGIFNSSGTNLINDTATLECDDGYTLSSVDMADAVITCQASGDWTASGSTCIKICDSIPSINNGSFILSGRNVESAIAVLTCDSGYNESEADVSITCQSDGSWTSTDATCIRNCGIPAVVDNGVFNFNGSNLVNDTAALECTGGYTTSTEIISDATITCQENGDWTSSAATCVKICDSLPVQSNGSFELSGRNVDGATAELKCDVGFNVSDSDFIITCQSDGSWTEIDSTCLRSCGMPPVVSSGIFNSSGTNLINDTATLECDDGYTLSSVDMADAVITCQASGDWTASGSTCIKICDSIPSINNGSFVLSGRNVESAIAVLTCDSGYNESEADVSITCQSDGSWTSTDATCIRNCGIPAVVDNGVFNFNGSNLVNDTATLECTGGYTTSTEIISDATITCQENGDWTSSAATCVKICDSLPVQSNGSFELSGRNVDGATAELKCDVGFNVSDSDFIITCQSDGSWTEIDSTCLRSCGMPPVVSSGIFNSSGTNLINDTATLECDDGYTLSSVDIADAVITCQASGDWTASGSTCIKICDSIPSINNGSFILSGRNVESAIAVLTCDSGYNESEADVSITCQSDGSWTSTDATCIRNCGIPAVVDNGVFNFNGSNLVNDTATLECTGGYTTSTEIISEATITCQENGDWTSSAATCVKICDSLPVYSNGTFELRGRNVEGSTAELKCDTGFNVSGSDFIMTCQSDGSWTGMNAICLRNCGTPDVVVNGAFNSNGSNLVNDTATLECTGGYTTSTEIISEATITCQENGDWTSSAATCVKLCDGLPTQSNGSFELNGRNVEGATADLSCNAGFNVSDTTAFITCQSNGSWTDTDATCIRSCGTPPIISDGEYVSNGNDLESDEATLTCAEGFRISSAAIDDATISCQADGSWTSGKATCEKECGSSGTDFMLGFFENIFNRGRPYIYVLTNEPTEVTVTVPYYPDTVTFVLKRFARIQLSNSVTGRGDEELSNKGISIQSDKPITVYAHHHKGGDRGRSAEGTLILPVECAAAEYLVVAHDESARDESQSQMMIVGLTDNTQVNIDLPSGDTKSITLDKFSSYHYREEDLTGAIITANAAVVTLAGHQCANLPSDDTAYCDYIMEQMPPMSSLKKAYIISYMEPRPTYSVRIVAAHDDTEAVVRDTSGAVIETISLDKSESVFGSFGDEDTISITSNKGILVAQYGHGMSIDSFDFGDPSMVVVPGLGQFENNYHIHTPTEFYDVNYVTVVIDDTYGVSGLRLNKDTLDTTNSISINVPGYGDFKVLHVELNKPLNKLKHKNAEATYGAVLYGFSNRVGYSWMAGRVV